MKKYIKHLCILCVSIVMVSCSDTYLDVNNDENNPTLDVLSPDLILPVAQDYSAQVIAPARLTNTFGNLMMANWSQSDGFAWYPDEFQYAVSSSFYTAIWNTTYLRALKQYRVLQSYSGSQYDNYKAIGKIMESYHFQILVDIYGDIPYSQALQRGNNPAPVYDDAKTVYAGIVAELDTAMALIDAATDDTLVPGADDVTFAGDMTQWKKFANTIKLRVLVRQSGDGALNASFAGMQDIGFIDSDVVVNPGYAMLAGQQSPFWNSYGRDAGGNVVNNNNATCATPYILNKLSTNFDPRIDFIYERPATGHVGVVQGLALGQYDIPTPDQFDPSLVSNIGPGLLKSASQDAVIFALADSYFLQSEAIFKGYLPGDAQAAYESGITASFDYLGAGDAAEYYTQSRNLVSWNSSPNKLEAIIFQKYIALNGIDAIQSWFDYNRTGFPSDVPLSMMATTPNRPVRLLYPSSETTANVNVPAASNAFTDKIFWAN